MNTFDFQSERLTDQQKEVALKIVESGREVKDILTEYGIDGSEFANWITEGAFPAYTSFLTQRYASADEPYVWSKLFDAIREGNLQAIKLYFSIKDKKGAVQSTFAPSPELSELRSDIFGEEEDNE